jgi:hypothetical protein
VINVTAGKLVRLFVDDEPFVVRYGGLRTHERLLDFRVGVLSRRGRLGGARRAGGPRAFGPAGVVHPAGGRGGLLRGRVGIWGGVVGLGPLPDR